MQELFFSSLSRPITFLQRGIQTHAAVDKCQKTSQSVLPQFKIERCLFTVEINTNKRTNTKGTFRAYLCRKLYCWWSTCQINAQETNQTSMLAVYRLHCGAANGKNFIVLECGRCSDSGKKHVLSTNINKIEASLRENFLQHQASIIEIVIWKCEAAFKKKPAWKPCGLWGSIY